MQQLSLHVGVGSAFEDGGHGHTLGGGVGGCMFCHSSVQQTWSVQSWLSIHTVQRFSMSLQMVNKDVLLPKSCRNLFVCLTPDPSDGKVFVVRKAFLELHSKAAWRRSQDENKHTNKQTCVCEWMMTSARLCGSSCVFDVYRCCCSQCVTASESAWNLVAAILSDDARNNTRDRIQHCFTNEEIYSPFHRLNAVSLTGQAVSA